MTNPPPFIIGIEQQPVENFAMLRDLGINTLVRIPAGSDPGQWAAEANRLGFWQVRQVIGSPAVDAGNPLLLAWTYDDEPDLKKIPPAVLLAQRDAAARIANPVRQVPWHVTLSGGLVLGLVAGGPDEATYRRYLATADLIGSDIYPVAGWNDQISLYSPGRCVDRLASWGAVPTSQLMYVECARQNNAWLKNPDGGRCVTPQELRLIAGQAVRRQCRGIVYFSWSETDKTSFNVPPAVQWEMQRFNRELSL